MIENVLNQNNKTKEKTMAARDLNLLVEKIIDETRMSIAHAFLRDLYNYDGRSDCNYIYDAKDVVAHIVNTEVSKVFVEDVTRQIVESINKA